MASRRFGEFPLEENSARVSPRFAKASSWRANIFSNPKSLAVHVIAHGSEFRQSPGRARLSFLYLPESSSAKCIAAAALPPFPQENMELPRFMQSEHIFAAWAIWGESFFRDLRVSISSSIFFSGFVFILQNQAFKIYGYYQHGDFSAK